jgi:hypothetical protein
MAGNLNGSRVDARAPFPFLIQFSKNTGNAPARVMNFTRTNTLANRLSQNSIPA